MNRSIEKILFFLIFSFMISPYLNAYGGKSLEYLMEYKSKRDLSIYSQKMGKDLYKIVLYKKLYHEDDKNYFNLDVYYNGRYRRVRYYVHNSGGVINIVNADMTDAFCNKNYVVVTMQHYYEINETEAKNHYMDIFVNMEDNDESVTYLNYDHVKNNPNGPLEFMDMLDSIEYKCIDDKLTFEY